MGASDPVERDLYQGLIRLAAAYVHRARRNGLGLTKNLVGAAASLGRVAASGEAAHIEAATIESVSVLLTEVVARIPVDGGPADLNREPPSLSMAGGW